MRLSTSPFPWQSLDAVRRGDIALLGTMRRAASRVVDLAAADVALREMLGPCELSLRVRRVTASPPRVDESAVGALIASGERADRRRAFAIIVEQPLAATLASRALRRPSGRVQDSSARPSTPLAAAFAAILVAAARRNAISPLRVISAGSAHAMLGELVALDPNPIGVTMTVLLDHDAYVVHAFAPRSALEPLASVDLDARSLAALDQTPIEIPLVAAALAMSATELAALAPGDALLPLTLKREGDTLRGTLLLAPPESDVAFTADLGEGGRLVLRDGPLPLAFESSAEDAMVDKDALAQSIGEAPVVVRVEVGSAQMSARDWAALGAGDVIALGKRIGDHVVLRVGGVEVARGELVDVEGEIGVRIIARAGGTVA